MILTTYFSYAMLYVLGHIRDALGRLAGSRYGALTLSKVRAGKTQAAFRSTSAHCPCPGRARPLRSPARWLWPPRSGWLWGRL